MGFYSTHRRLTRKGGRLHEWWCAHWPDLSMAVYYIGTVAVGLLALTESSPTLSVALKGGAALYALGMIAMGTMALVSLAIKSRRSEAVAVGGMAILTLIHGALLFIVAGRDGAVTGLRLGIAPFMMVVWCHFRTQVVATRRDLQKHIDAAEVNSR